MERFVQRLDNARNAIDDADYILVGGGAGLSTAAGMEYGGLRFRENFKDFIEKYSMSDMYSAGFYPFKTQEEKWGYWARHILLNRYSNPKTDVYTKLFDLVKDRDYFVLTTNVDHQFWLNGFEDERIFATQGDYGLFQCSEACHDKLYDNEKIIKEMVENTKDCKIPTELIPKCPVCGEVMETNLRKDNHFVQDKKWYESNERYSEYLSKINNQKTVFLEIGVGYNTPGIIRYPFEQFTYDNPKARLIRINRDFPQAIRENTDKTISFDEDVEEILDYWLTRI